MEMDAHLDYWPDCDYDPWVPTLDAEIVNGTDINSHKLTLTSKVMGEYGNFCPGIDGSVVWEHDGEELMTVALTAAEVKTMYRPPGLSSA